MTLDYAEVREAFCRAKDMAFEVYLSNKGHGSPSDSVAFDSGRYDALKQSIEILDKLAER